MGLMGPPYAFEDVGGLQWAPVRDAPDGWVQVGSVGTCSMNLHLQSPREKNEGITRHVLCCAGPAPADDEGPPDAGPSDAAAPTAAADDDDGRVAAVVRAFHPILYDRSHGWGGRTHDEGAEFCAGKGRALCRAEA